MTVQGVQEKKNHNDEYAYASLTYTSANPNFFILYS